MDDGITGEFTNNPSNYLTEMRKDEIIKFIVYPVNKNVKLSSFFHDQFEVLGSNSQLRGCVRGSKKKVEYKTRPGQKIFLVQVRHFTLSDNFLELRSTDTSVDIEDVVMGDITFTPAACIYYHSKTGRSGHYTAIIRTNENKYYHVNDGEVSENESWSLNINPQDTPPKVIAVFMANKGVFLKTELIIPIGFFNSVFKNTPLFSWQTKECF